MRKKLLVLLLAGALLLSGCGPGEAESVPEASSAGEQGAASSNRKEGASSAPFALAASPTHSFHPSLSDSSANLTLAPLMYEGLFALDSRFQAEPLLCQSYAVSEDGLIWDFTLREGITFSDGTPLTGEIAARALNTARGEGSRYAARLEAVASVQGSQRQVTITLSRPCGGLPQLLDIPITLDDGARPLGTGPYVLTDTGDELALAAREDWRGGTDSLPARQIPLVSLNRGDELMPAFNTGEVGLIDVDLTGDSALGSSERYQVWDYNTTQLLYVGFNTRTGLCRDQAVRRAMARAIDREYVTETILARHGTASALPIHPASPWYDPDMAAELSYNLSELTELGLEGRPVTLLVNIENTAKSAAANHVASQLESAGLVVSVERLPWAEYLEAVAGGDFDLYMGEVYLTPDLDLTALLGSEGSLNYGGWASSTADSLLAAFREAREGGRETAASALCRHLCQQAPIAPICFRSGTVLTQYGRVEGLSPVYGNLFAGLESWRIQE